MIYASYINTLWDEDPSVLERRHVGRRGELKAAHGFLQSFASGGQPLPLLLYGPRGVGKTHVLVLARQRAAERLSQSGIQWLVIPEEIPAARTAKDLIRRLEGSGLPPWMMLAAEAPRTVGVTHRVVVIEGLFRHLAAMDVPEHRALRAWIVEHPEVYVIATGVGRLPASFGRDGAFYGLFDPYPLGSIEPETAQTYLDEIAPRAARERPTWGQRRVVILALSGGSPQLLSAFSEALTRLPDAGLDACLQRVLHPLTNAFQARFMNLAPQEQQVVECLSFALGETTPTKIGEAIQRSPTHASQLARRLMTSGVLLHRSSGRRTWYRLTEDLFRFWFESRMSAWHHTRITTVLRALDGASLDTDAPVLEALKQQLQAQEPANLHPELELLRRIDH